MIMERNDIHRHCPEVEDLMGGKMPFVTRYGITLTVGVLLVIGVVLFFSDGALSQLVTEMLEYTARQITSRIR